MCANTKCPHWAGGCKLFNGEAWRQCRSAVEATNKTKAKNKKGK